VKIFKDGIADLLRVRNASQLASGGDAEANDARPKLSSGYSWRRNIGKLNRFNFLL